MTVNGIDVSKWQASTPPLAGMEFLFARASIGTLTDYAYQMHRANARRAGLLVGAYHFNWNAASIAEQVRVFLASAGDVDFYAIDVEGQQAFSQAQTKDFIARMHAAGKTCGLYHSASGFFDAGQDWDWVAKWSATPPSRHWDFWQHQGSPLDKDIFNGDIAALLRLARIPNAPDSGIVGVEMTTAVPFDNYGPWTCDIAIGRSFYDLAGVMRGTVSVTQTDVPTPSKSNNVGGALAGQVVLLVGLQTGGINQYVYIKESDVTDLKPVAIPVASVGDGYTKATQDAAVAAAIATQKATSQATINAAVAAATKATTELASAPAKERERIALRMGADEAARVRATA